MIYYVGFIIMNLWEVWEIVAPAYFTQEQHEMVFHFILSKMMGIKDDFTDSLVTESLELLNHIFKDKWCVQLDGPYNLKRRLLRPENAHCQC